MTVRSVYLLVLFFLQAQISFAQSPCSYKGGNVDFLPTITCPADFTALQDLPLKKNYSNVQSIKIVYDLQNDLIYFTNSKKYRYHYDFCSDFLNTYSNILDFNTVEYSAQSNRRYVLANLNHYKLSKLYTLEFFPDDEGKQAYVQRCFKKAKQTVYFGADLKIADNSGKTSEWRKTSSMPFISADDLYGRQTFQSLNPGTAYGFLRLLPGAVEGDSIRRGDIVVLDRLPNNLPVCAATITTVFQTPLCHINILSQNRGTPNAVFKSALTDQHLLKLKDRFVCLKITRDTLTIEETPYRPNIGIQCCNENKPISLFCNNNFKRLADIRELNSKSVSFAGGKAANTGELAKIKLSGNRSLPIPAEGFAIPFYFYTQHVKEHNIEPLILKVLQDSAVMKDRIQLAARLKEIRNQIEHAAVNEELLKLISEKIGGNRNTNFRFRSSTNAEDIPGFNGAGLYDSKTGNLSKPDKPVAKAITEVWASLWKLRAFEERLLFNIDQKNLAMGILVNRAFGNEAANGVAVTKHLYREGYPAFTINIQKGETSVVQPTDSIRAEQFIMNFSAIVTGSDRIAVDYITHSSLSPNVPILTTAEIKLLADYLKAIKQHYWSLYRRKSKKSYEDFAVDVEFKLEEVTRKIVIKQARLY